MKRLVAHSGSPYSGSRIREALAAATASPAPIEETENQLAGTVKRKYCLLTTSGRFALYSILRAVRRAARGEKLILPAYAGPTVLNAVARAGFTPVFCDFAPGRLDFDYGQLASLAEAGATAVVSINYFGLMCDYDRLRSIAREKELVLVEDACPSFGARYRDEPSGSLGEFSCISFGLSKSLSAAKGGALFTDSEKHFQALKESVTFPPAGGRQGRLMFDFLASSLLLRPRLYYLLRLLPFRFEKEDFEFDPRREGRMGARQAALLSRLLPALPELTAQRRENYRLIHQALGGLKNIRLFEPPPSAEGAALRFPFLCRDAGHRERLIARLKEAGVQSDPYYRLEREDYFIEIRERFPVAADYAGRLLTLPTHRYLRPSDVETISEVIGSDQ